MKTPEKLYLIQHNGLICYCRNNDEDIEYTRTDAFIEKAYEWLKSNLYNYAGEDDKRNIVPFDDSVFKDFIKYMEK